MTTAVVGGGLSGLVRAHALAERGEPVLLFEEAPVPGGVVRSERQDGYLLELGPNSVRPAAPLWSLVVRLGLENQALLAAPGMPRFVDFGGRLVPVPMSPGGLVSTKLLTARGKLRLLAEPFVQRGAPDGESVAAFFARRFGAEIGQRLVEPFVSGIWGGRADLLAVSEAFPQLARWERSSGSVFSGAIAERRKKPKDAPRGRRGLLSFPDGLAALPRRLAEELGNRVHLGRRVDSIARSGDGWRLSLPGGDVDADRLCVAAPAPKAAALVASFAPEAAEALRSIPHAPLVVLHAACARPEGLEGFGHLVVPQPGRRILGAIWSSSLFPGRAPEGRALFTVFLGGARDPGALDMSDDGIVAAASKDFSAVGLPGSLEAVRVTRYAGAIPQYDFGHAQRIATIAAAEKESPGLSLIGSYRGGVSVGDVVQSALALPD
jgi:oxygen-dependent protoporphyrinogen oxidase